MAAILIIDDSISMIAFLAQTLEGAGHVVTPAPDGKVGLALMRQQAFDLVITDLYMPEVDGLETITRAREARLFSRLIAISSSDSLVDLLPAARLLGATRTLHKPFTAPQLFEVVGAVLRLPAVQTPPSGAAAPARATRRG
jgi:CheY-like chemotaxis protein